jgi:hypothetical protein
MFKIIKRESGWWHIFNSNSKEVNISDFEAVLDNVAQTFIIQNLNGANVPKLAVNITDIIVIDETDASVEETFADVEALKVRLTALGYTPYLGAGNADSITGLIQEGTNVTITGSGTLADPYIISASGGSSTTPTLQEVTDEGNITDVGIELDNSVGEIGVTGTYGTDQIGFFINDAGDTYIKVSNGIGGVNVYEFVKQSPLGLGVGISFGNVLYFDDKISVGGIDYPLPNGASSQIATLADITGGGGYTVVSANQTAVNDTNYTVVANATFTDPSPTEGKGYVVYVRNGTATIGGTGYGVGSLAFRVFHSGAWSTRVYLDQTQVGSATQTALDAKADKSTSAFSIKANNTASTANETEFTFRQSGLSVYSGTITWTGTTAPSGAESHTFNWQQIGNLVQLNLNLHYATAGNGLNAVAITLPSGLPDPVRPTGFTGASERLYIGSGRLAPSDTGVLTTGGECFIRRNSADNGFELVISQTAGNHKIAQLTIEYFTS